MSQTDTAQIAPDEKAARDRAGGVAAPPGRAPRSRGIFQQYKPEQGKYTRTGSFIGALALIIWGALFIRGRLTGYEDVARWWGLLITPGIPIAFAVILGAVAWWACFGNRAASDFMIATEGEMKKVNWSNRRELLGSTKVVIMFTVLLAVFLFVVDLIFVSLFSWIGVLKT